MKFLIFIPVLKKILLIYGSILALLMLLLQWWDYRLMLHDITVEVYVAVIATFCTALGVWAGLRLTRQTRTEVVQIGSVPKTNREEFDISEREYEVLRLMAEGCSNREIADRLFISTNTVKSHAANLFFKLEVKRRTQAVHEARRLNLI